jgi:hypothetical protein
METQQATEAQQLERSIRRGIAKAGRAISEATNHTTNFEAYSKPDSAVYTSPK